MNNESRNSWSWQIKGCWILVLGLVLIFVSSELASGYKPHASASTVSYDSAPYYFMQLDFISGAWAGVGLLLGVLLSLTMWRRYYFFSYMNLWMSILWFGDKVMIAGVIYIKCPGLFMESGSPWNTFDAYFQDGRFSASFFHTNQILVVIAVIAPLIYRKMKKIPVIPISWREGKAQ